METSSRRKSCDTCFRKKLRCDMLKPSCSNCSLYGVICRTTSIRRKAAVPKPRPADVTPQTDESSGSGSSLEARLARIEAKLDDLRSPGSSLNLDEVLRNDFGQQEATTISNTNTPSETSARSDSERGHAFDVPPLLDILPVVDSYFRQFNTALPLFNQSCFTRMLNRFYSNPSAGSKVEWAAINVVLAIGYCARSIAGDDIALRFDDSKITNCINNAREHIDEIMTQKEEIHSIQVLLGLAILHQGNVDQETPSIWVATALRLAHRIYLHSKASLAGFSSEVAQMRTNIFWIAYFLDKDASLRLSIPSFQLDNDVDLELPGTKLDSTEGVVQSLDGLSHFNYFRARVLLSHIGGKIYDELYSNRSRKLSAEARQQKIISLDRILDQWHRSIPTPLQAEHMTQTLGKVAGSLMIGLHRSYLFCLIMLHGVYSLESPWMQKLGGFSIMALQQAGNNTDVCMKDFAPPLPSAWAKLVTTSRSSLRLYLSELNGVGMIWPDARSNFTAFVILWANIIYYPQHDFVEHDRRLIREAISLTDKQLNYDGLDKYKQLQCVLVGLERLADITTEFSNANGGYQLAEFLPHMDNPYSALHFEGSAIENTENIFNVDPQMPFSMATWLDESANSIDLDVPDLFQDRSTTSFTGWNP